MFKIGKLFCYSKKKIIKVFVLNSDWWFLTWNNIDPPKISGDVVGKGKDATEHTRIHRTDCGTMIYPF